MISLTATANTPKVISIGIGVTVGITTRSSKTTIKPPTMGQGPIHCIPIAAIGGKRKDMAASIATQGSSRLSEELMNLIYDIVDRSNGAKLFR